MKVNFTVSGSSKMTSMIGNLLSVSRCTGMEHITCEPITSNFSTIEANAQNILEACFRIHLHFLFIQSSSRCVLTAIFMLHHHSSIGFFPNMQHHAKQENIFHSKVDRFWFWALDSILIRPEIRLFSTIPTRSKAKELRFV